MSREDFTNFLSTLPQRRFRYEGEAVPTVVSELIDSLEYRLENLFYEVGFGEQNDEYADAVIVSQITASLQLVIEVRPRSINRTHSRNSYPEKLVDDFQAVYSVVVTPYELYCSDGDVTETLYLKSLSNRSIEKAYSKLKAPTILPRKPLSHFYKIETE